MITTHLAWMYSIVLIQHIHLGTCSEKAATLVTITDNKNGLLEGVYDIL